MNREPPRCATWQEPDETPVVLPHVVITVTETGVLDANVDGIGFSPPEGEVWTRSTLGDLLDAITQDRTVTVRIEVRESDGSVFTDIIRARRHPTPEPPETGTEDTRQGKHTRNKRKRGAQLVEATAEGFVPDEDIAVAVIISHTDATGTGSARALLDRGQLASLLPDGAGEVVLFGRSSGTTHIRRLS